MNKRIRKKVLCRLQEWLDHLRYWLLLEVIETPFNLDGVDWWVGYRYLARKKAREGLVQDEESLLSSLTDRISALDDGLFPRYKGCDDVTDLRQVCNTLEHHLHTKTNCATKTTLPQQLCPNCNAPLPVKAVLAQKSCRGVEHRCSCGQLYGLCEDNTFFMTYPYRPTILWLAAKEA